MTGEWIKSISCSESGCIEVMWVRASGCESNMCIEATVMDGMIAVRNSSKPKLGIKTFSVGVWMWILSQVEARNDIHWFDYATGLEPSWSEYQAFRMGVRRWEFEPRILAGDRQVLTSTPSRG